MLTHGDIHLVAMLISRIADFASNLLKDSDLVAAEVNHCEIVFRQNSPLSSRQLQLRMTRYGWRAPLRRSRGPIDLVGSISVPAAAGRHGPGLSAVHPAGGCSAGRSRGACTAKTISHSRSGYGGSAVRPMNVMGSFLPPMRVPHPDTHRQQAVADRLRVHAEDIADPGQ